MNFFIQKMLKQQFNLYKLNVAAFSLHLITFIVSLILSIVFAGQSFQTELTSDFRNYGNNSANPPPQAGKFFTNLQSLGFYQLIWINLPFCLITAFFHALIAWNPTINKKYNIWVFKEHRNPLRWIEYSITASLMTWVIMQLSGITNIFLLIMTALIGNIILQAQGYYMEILKVNWIPMLVGWLVFLGQWSIIFAYFLEALTSPRPPTATQVPWFVYTIVIGLFFQFAAFGFVQLFRYLGYIKSAYKYEMFYIILSLTAKIFLSLNLVIGIAVNNMSN